MLRIEADNDINVHFRTCAFSGNAFIMEQYITILILMSSGTVLVVDLAFCLQGNYSSKRWQDSESFKLEIFICFCHRIVKYFINGERHFGL